MTDNKHRRVRCKYCGAVLVRDAVGLRCPTHNCQWEHGLPENEEAEGGEDEQRRRIAIQNSGG